MAKILIIGRQLEEQHVFGSAELMAEQLNAATQGGHEYFFTHFDDLAFVMEPGTHAVHDLRNGPALADYDFVHLRDWFKFYRDPALAVAIHLEAAGVPFFNSEALKNRSSGKLSQYMYLATKGISFPKTFSASAARTVEHYQSLSDLGFPLVAKARGGRRGLDNYLVHDEAELERVMREQADVEFVLQEFIPNDHDLRVIMHGPKAKVIIKRQRPADSDSHLNNTSQGAEATLLPLDYLPENVLADCYALASRFGRDFTGADVIFHPDTGKHWLLEVNNMPQMETGSFVAEKLAAFETAVEDTINKG